MIKQWWYWSCTNTFFVQWFRWVRTCIWIWVA
jgi:hypothetical protein